mmetsp:Transcript_32926/g.50347  ORF Transcript_32926/g.50347 Transcript_32926/m.50347 type:complete len:83 (+) Transcript_32926:284-532(+)
MKNQLNFGYFICRPNDRVVQFEDGAHNQFRQEEKFVANSDVVKDRKSQTFRNIGQVFQKQLRHRYHDGHKRAGILKFLKRFP